MLSFQELDLRIKWPNDIYANGTIKLGGLIATSVLENGMAVCNIGVGLNLDNERPTISLNDVIRDWNKQNPSKVLSPLRRECLFAAIFNELERICTEIEAKKSFDDFFALYYQLWLHQDQDVHVLETDSAAGETATVKRPGRVIGVDEYGYLRVQLLTGGEPKTVHPDGNSFDMMNGLILPKYH